MRNTTPHFWWRTPVSEYIAGISLAVRDFYNALGMPRICYFERDEFRPGSLEQRVNFSKAMFDCRPKLMRQVGACRNTPGHTHTLTTCIAIRHVSANVRLHTNIVPGARRDATLRVDDIQHNTCVWFRSSNKSKWDLLISKNIPDDYAYCKTRMCWWYVS